MGDVRFNAVFFMLGAFSVGASFVALAVTSILPYVQGGPVAGAASEYALLTALGYGLGGIGFAALALGAFVFSLNYEPIKPEAKLVLFSGLPYGVFLITSYFARIHVGGPNDFFGYAVSRTSEGTATLYVLVPESYATLGPYLVVGSFAALVCFFGLAQLLANMKIVKEVGALSITLTRGAGFLAFGGQLLLFLGWSAFSGAGPGTEWFGAWFILYYLGYLVCAFAGPLLGVVVVWRVGSVFWDAAKTVRYLSDFSKRTTAAAQRNARQAVDERPWWEKLSEDGKGEQ